MIGVGVGAAALYGAGSRFGNAGPGALATEGEQAESQALFWQHKNDGSERQAAFAFSRHHNHRDKGGVWQSTWLGVPTIQNPLGVWVTQEILHEVKPDFVVETGTHRGGSAALWATLIVQDTGIGEPAYGMNRAADGVRDFLATTDEFEVDRSREAYGITNNAAGFLRRIRG